MACWPCQRSSFHYEKVAEISRTLPTTSSTPRRASSLATSIVGRSYALQPAPYPGSVQTVPYQCGGMNGYAPAFFALDRDRSLTCRQRICHKPKLVPWCASPLPVTGPQQRSRRAFRQLTVLAQALPLIQLKPRPGRLAMRNKW